MTTDRPPFLATIASGMAAGDEAPKPEPTITASDALKNFAADHIRPTLEALTTLEETIAACKKSLSAELAKLCDQSEGFAVHNVEAIKCLNICTDAVTQLVNGRNNAKRS
jgi:hypothetical protein